MLYFGYGSNLDREDLSSWCRERGLDPLLLARVGPAYLPDRRLAFTHRSATRGGGVLDVPESKGTAVAGVMFRVPGQDAIATLDLKESRGHAYRRIETVALTEDGGEHPVFAYEVEPLSRLPFVEPADGYLEIVRRGYHDHELSSDTLNAAARGASHEGPVTRLFVYGTLRSGEERHHVLTRHRASAAEAAVVDGTLLHLGAYPGLIVDGAQARVRGELYSVPDPAALFSELDPVETFQGFGAPGSLYRRAIVRANRVDAGATPAWTYVYNGSREGAGTIGSGDWLHRTRA